MTPRQRILAVGFSAREHARSTPFLDRDDFDVDRFPRPEGAIELLRNVPLDVVLVRYPLGMDMGDFLDRMRAPDSASRHASLVVLAETELLATASKFIGHGANRVIDLATEPPKVQETAAELLQIAPRREARFLARLEARLEGDAGTVLGVVRNTSASGLLVEIDRHFELGTALTFELTVPNAHKPVRGEAEVARQTDPDREKLIGVGLRILSFEGDCQATYASYLESVS